MRVRQREDPVEQAGKAAPTGGDIDTTRDALLSEETSTKAAPPVTVTEPPPEASSE